MIRSTPLRNSRLQERRAAKEYNGSVSPGSGATWHHKADVRSNEYLVECKTTSKKSYSLKHEDLLKIYLQAIVENRIPVFEIEFSEASKKYVVLDAEDWHDIRMRLRGS